MHQQRRGVSIQEKKEQALQISIKEGAANSFAGSISDSFITPFALALNATPLHISVLNSVSGLLSPLAQWYGDILMEKEPRKRIILRFIILQIAFSLLFVVLGLLVWKGLLASFAVYILIAGYACSAICAGISYVVWFSWMGDLISPEQKGKYFSKRNVVTGVVSVAALLIGGFLLDAFKTKGIVLIGFGILFFFAVVVRFISYVLLKRQYAPPFILHKKDYFSLASFLRRLDNFGKFAVYYSAFNFALMIASPFFAVYMLQELGFSYVMLMTVTLSSSVFYIIFSPLIGRFSDTYGNRKLLFLGTFLLGFNPLLWIFIKEPIMLILIPQLIVGLANAALVIGVTNFTYDSSKPEHRALCVSYTNILAGIATFFGAILGGLALKYAPSSINAFFFVFLISGILRLGTSFLLIKHVEEVKKVKRFPGIHIPNVHTLRTIHTELESFTSFSQHQYSEGLKIWNPYKMNVLPEKKAGKSM